MMRTITSIISRARIYRKSLRVLDYRTTGFLSCCNSNLNGESRLLVQNASRYMSVLNHPVSENDLMKILDHIVDAQSSGESQEFQRLFHNQSLRELIDERNKILQNLYSLSEFENDQEMKKLAEEEKAADKERLRTINKELLDLIVRDFGKNTCDDIILEISAGTGGQESMLFVKDLLDMYVKHFIYLGYNYDIIDLDETGQGGYRHVSVMISGENSFEKLRHEAGVHRVQRVPTTEKSGRIHTSVVSVAVMPQASEIEIELNPEDLKIDAMRASGPGGQNVNKTNSAIRITHLPTGIVTGCQTSRSQIQNRKIALLKLRTKLFQEEMNNQQSSRSSMRKQQMGMGERNEKIRTYNYNQNRVTDHRLVNKVSNNLKAFMDGGRALDDLHVQLQQELQYKILIEAVKNMQ